ncbi:ACP S-malonyltransferase [Candidatus Margulisiibacteriota bacterium]
MTKFGFVFPGQGSQKPGMGKVFFDNYEEIKNIFASANSVLGRDLAKICFEGPDEELRQTINAQPSIFLVSVCIAELLKKARIVPSLVAGHSLGEITAYYVSSVFDLETALNVIDKRARAMANSYPSEDSAMAAILTLDVKTVEKLVKEVSGKVVVANYNSPGQVVISGEKQAVADAVQLCKEQGGRVLPLNVSGPFHSPLMSKGSREFGETLEEVKFIDATVPIVLNRTASPETKASALKDNLPLQIISPVNWIDSMLYMSEKVDVIIECGPGRVLSGLIKKINPNIQLVNISDEDSYLRFIEEFSGSKRVEDLISG